jgi:hypothetical protein
MHEGRTGMKRLTEKEADMPNMELIVAYEDGTWDTVIEKIPTKATADPQQWAFTEGGPRYRKAVYVGIFNENVDPDSR